MIQSLKRVGGKEFAQLPGLIGRNSRHQHLSLALMEGGSDSGNLPDGLSLAKNDLRPATPFPSGTVNPRESEIDHPGSIVMTLASRLLTHAS
jgi:hypothetical protein